MNNKLAARKISPWGKIQYRRFYGEGIMSVGTAGHGGFFVDKSLRQTMPEYFQTKDGWYEEDCEWAIVAVCFPERFPEDVVESANKTLKTWYPYLYEMHYDVVLVKGESFKKDRDIFLKNHENDLLTVSATNSVEFPDYVEVAAKIGGVTQSSDPRYSKEYKYFLVSRNEYENRDKSHGYFKIDPNRHLERTKHDFYKEYSRN